MPLSFSCSEDFRKMKSDRGKKFCGSCQKHVYDVRRKSVEKILALRKSKGNCCLIIHEEQLIELDQSPRKKRLAPFASKRLPHVAGLIGLSLLSHNVAAQNYSPLKSEKEFITERDSEGKVRFAPKLLAKTPNGTEFKGKVVFSSGKRAKNIPIKIGFRDLDNVFVLVAQCPANKNGKFAFKLNSAQLNLLEGERVFFLVEKYEIERDLLHWKNQGGKIILMITDHRTVHGMGVDAILD
jgi:hypothetical protein